MVLRYTTIENITRRLAPRVAVDTAVQFGQNAVSSELITDQIGPQVEARIDRTLNESGVSPSSLDQYVLQGISEKLICCDVLTTYFVGQDVSDDPYGRLMCEQGAAELDSAANSTGGGTTGEKISFSQAITRTVSRADAAENINFR